MTFSQFYQVIRLYKPRHVVVAWMAAFLLFWFAMKVVSGAEAPPGPLSEPWPLVFAQCREEYIGHHPECARGGCRGAWDEWIKCAAQRVYGAALFVDNPNIAQICVTDAKQDQARHGGCMQCGDPVRVGLACFDKAASANKGNGK